MLVLRLCDNQEHEENEHIALFRVVKALIMLGNLILFAFRI